MTFEDLDIMAKTMWGESRNQDTSGQIAVASVIKTEPRLDVGMVTHQKKSV